MKLLLLVLSLGAIQFTIGPADAAQLRYTFTGTLNESLGDLPEGTPFEGSWTVTVPQAGTPFVGGPPGATEGRRYRYDEFRIVIAGEVFAQQDSELVFVSTTDLLEDPVLITFWPSGFSSDLSVTSATLFPSGQVPTTQFGAQVWKIGVTFNSDGQIWNNFALPLDETLLAQLEGAAVFDFLDGSGRVLGAIDSFNVALVPLPPAWLLSASCIAALAASRRQRRSSAETYHLQYHLQSGSMPWSLTGGSASCRWTRWWQTLGCGWCPDDRHGGRPGRLPRAPSRAAGNRKQPVRPVRLARAGRPQRADGGLAAVRGPRGWDDAAGGRRRGQAVAGGALIGEPG